MNNFPLIGLIVLLWTGTTFAQDRSDKVDSIIHSHVDKNNFSGNVLVVKDHSILFEKSYGLANREWNNCNSRDTKFRIASLTKQFTAMLILQLLETQDIDLHTPIVKYLPYYRSDTGNLITIHHLLTHTAGLSEYTDRDDFFTEISKQKYSPREFVEKFCSDSLISIPGSTYKYSNTGYYILGAIIEEVSKISYANLLQKNILDIVGMKNSGIENPTLILSERATGYHYSDSVFSNADYIDLASTIYSAGAMYSTTNDLRLWNDALISGKLISKENLERMLTPFLSNYGYGIGSIKVADPIINKEMHYILHQGAINGFRSLLTHVVNDNITLIILCNNFDTNLNPISNAIIYSLYNQSISQQP